MEDYSNQIMSGGAQVSSALQGLSNQIAQEKENDKARSYNSEEAQKSRDYNTWLLENQTQLKAQDARKAGLNPAFMNGSVLGQTPTPSGSPTSPNTTIPLDPQTILSNELLRAQASNVDAMTKKTNEETERQKIENQYLGDLMKSTIALNGSNISLNVANANLSKEQANEVAQAIGESEMRITKMVGEMNIMRKQVDIMTEDQKIKQIEALWKEREIQATIYNLRTQAELNETQANDIVKSFVYRMYGLTSQAELNDANKTLCTWNSESAKLHFNLDQQFGTADRMIKVVNGCTQALESVSAATRNYAQAAHSVRKTIVPIPGS